MHRNWQGGPVLAAKIDPGGPILAADQFFRYTRPSGYDSFRRPCLWKHIAISYPLVEML